MGCLYLCEVKQITLKTDVPDGIEQGKKKMKKSLLLAIVFSCLLVVPQQIKAQTYDDYYNLGYILGAGAKKLVENKRAREAEQQRIEREREEAQRQYELEQQRIANERYAIQQREAEARRAEEERLRLANEAKRAEEERLRLEREAASARQQENAAKEYREYNSNVQILSPGDFIKFLTDDGESVYMSIDENMDLFYNNPTDKEVRISCNRATIKVKYVGNPDVQTVTDACSIVIPSRSYNTVKWSDVFFNLSDNNIESIRVRFVETQVRTY